MTFSTLSSSEKENNTGFSSSAFGLKKVFVNEAVQCGVMVRVVVAVVAGGCLWGDSCKGYPWD